MSHRITLKFLNYEIDHHRLGNFVEAIWVNCSEEGFLDWSGMSDALLHRGRDMSFSVGPRRAKALIAILERIVREHMMESWVEIVHERRVRQTDG